MFSSSADMIESLRGDPALLLWEEIAFIRVAIKDGLKRWQLLDRVINIRGSLSGKRGVFPPEEQLHQ